MSPVSPRSLSNEELVSLLQANPTFTSGLGSGKGPKQTGLTSANSGKQFSSPAQGVWPGLVSILYPFSSPSVVAPLSPASIWSLNLGTAEGAPGVGSVR